MNEGFQSFREMQGQRRVTASSQCESTTSLPGVRTPDDAMHLLPLRVYKPYPSQVSPTLTPSYTTTGIWWICQRDVYPSTCGPEAPSLKVKSFPIGLSFPPSGPANIVLLHSRELWHFFLACGDSRCTRESEGAFTRSPSLPLALAVSQSLPVLLSSLDVAEVLFSS